MHIVLLEPYDSGSHAAWMRGYEAHSAHQVTILSLPGQFWKWRMQGGAVTLARQFLQAGLAPDLIIASDMLNLATFLALTRARTAGIPAVVYFHENQLTYPLGPRQRGEIHFQLALINYVSALAADAVFFNSRFHQESFLQALPGVLKHYPDYTELETVAQLKMRSQVLPLGLALERFDRFRPAPGEPMRFRREGRPMIVWNHRWEHDKNPRPFLNAVQRLARQGLAFDVALTGENFRQAPAEFEAARDALGERVVQYGYLEAFADYARLLWEADLQVSSANHDFFGISTCEAIYCGCSPVLPHRLNYPDLIPAQLHSRYLYREGQIQTVLQTRLENPQPPEPALRAHIACYDWAQQGPHYDAVFEAVARDSKAGHRLFG